MSDPGMSGSGCGRALLPSRIQASHGPTPAALTRTSTWSRRGWGSGTSASFSTLGAPNSETTTAFTMPPLAVVSGQYGSLIRHEDGEQSGRLAGARVLADQVVSAEVFEKGFAGVIDTRRRVIDLRADITRDYVGEHNAAMMMRLRCSTWIVVDLHGRHGFSRYVGKLLGEYLANFFALPASG